MDGPCVTCIPMAAAVLCNDKVTDNSSEAQSCLCLRPTCLKCSCLSLVVLKSCRICSKRLLSLSQVQHTERCVYLRVGTCMGMFEQTGSSVTLNPTSAVLDKAHLALQASPCSGQKCLL